MGTLRQRLEIQSALKSFFQYFIPTLFGMMLMSVNIVIDGIFVGNGVGAVALASVNIAVPVFSIIIAIALLIGIGGGTLYSISMGQDQQEQAKQFFTMSIILMSIITIIISFFSYVYIEKLAYIFGANEETLPYVIDYMTVLLIAALIIALEVGVSIFVRNDGAPQIAMAGLVVTALLNIGLNYWMIFILKLEVFGAALATVIATAAGFLVYLIHFFREGSGLKFVKISWEINKIKSILTIGFPSFLSEAGMGIFIVGYNLAMAFYIGTNGLAAFSVINYLHTFMFLAFIGIGSTIQPMVSFYFGAKRRKMIKDTVKIAEVTSLLLGLLFLTIGIFGAKYLVAIFGIESKDIFTLATTGLKLFFIGYLFMGINFVYMTFYQSIGLVKPSLLITLFRGVIVLILMLLILPPIFGVAGIWLALPVTEAVVAIFLIVYARPKVLGKQSMLEEI